jgi:uncharacterized SAM-binding protein YcdF (DUF218 family)
MNNTDRQSLRLFPFRPPSCPANLECLIILGARLNQQGEPGRVAKLRLRHALHLWREQHPGCRVLITGGQLPGTATSEARAMAAWSLTWVEETWGIEAREQLESCLILEEASRNTAASAANSLPLVQGRGFKAVGLVSDRFHIRRAHYLFRGCFTRHGIAVHPRPARGLLRHYWQQRRYLWLAKMALREGGAWLKVLWNLALGLGRRPRGQRN